MSRLFAVVVVLTFWSCGQVMNGPPGTRDVRDVRGNYALTYDDTVTLKLDVGGGTRTVTTQGYGGIADFGTVNGQPLTLNLAEFCARPEVACVIHTHATHLVALTLAGVWQADDIVPPITPYYVMKVGHVPLIPYHRPGDPQAAELVALRIGAMQSRGTPIRAVMLERLGPVVWHADPDSASAVLEELEETARLWLMTKPAPLAEAQIDELRRHFGARW